MQKVPNPLQYVINVFQNNVKRKNNSHTSGDSLKYARGHLNFIYKHQFTTWYLFIKIRQISVTSKFQKTTTQRKLTIETKNWYHTICPSCNWLLILVDNGNLSLPIIKIGMSRVHPIFNFYLFLQPQCICSLIDKLY